MWESIIGALISLYGDDLLEWGENAVGMGGNEYDNPYIKKALKRLDYASTNGYRPEVLANMKKSVNQRFGSEASSARASTTQRLMRENAPTQMREQILRDLTASLGGERNRALSDIDTRNEEVKMQALNSLLGGSLQVSPDTGEEEALASILGKLVANWGKGNSTGSDLNTYRLLNAKSGDYYNNRIGQFGDSYNGGILGKYKYGNTGGILGKYRYGR